MTGRKAPLLCWRLKALCIHNIKAFLTILIHQTRFLFDMFLVSFEASGSHWLGKQGASASQVTSLNPSKARHARLLPRVETCQALLVVEHQDLNLSNTVSDQICHNLGQMFRFLDATFLKSDKYMSYSKLHELGPKQPCKLGRSPMKESEGTFGTFASFFKGGRGGTAGTTGLRKNINSELNGRT